MARAAACTQGGPGQSSQNGTKAVEPARGPGQSWVRVPRMGNRGIGGSGTLLGRCGQGVNFQSTLPKRAGPADRPHVQVRPRSRWQHWRGASGPEELPGSQACRCGCFLRPGRQDLLVALGSDIRPRPWELSQAPAGQRWHHGDTQVGSPTQIQICSRVSGPPDRTALLGQCSGGGNRHWASWGVWGRADVWIHPPGPALQGPGIWVSSPSEPVSTVLAAQVRAKPGHCAPWR